MPKFLIIRFSSIGDIVLTSPVIRCLKQQVTDAEVHFVTKKNFSSVVEHNPYIDKKFFLEEDEQSLARELKREHYDAVIDLHHNLRTWRLKRFLGVPSFSFYKLNLEKWLMVNLKINRLPPIHIVDRYFETVKSFGVINDGKGLEYFITQEDGQAIQKLPAEFSNGYIAFVLGAKHPTKQLPADKVTGIIRQLNKPALLLGGKEDHVVAEEVMQRLQTVPVFNACGKLSLNESAALVKHAQRVITHDTGLMHIAAAFKKEIASVWGNTIPEFGMSPYYGDFKIQNWKFEIDLPCRPCSKIGFNACPQGHFKCMRDQDETGIANVISSEIGAREFVED